MTLTFQALWLLCALGAVVCAAASARRRRDLAGLAIGFVVAVIAASPVRLPDAATVGTLAVVAAAIALFRPRLAILSALIGGALAGMLSALVEAQGLSAFVSPVAAGLLLVVPVWLTRTRPHFAPERIREEGLLGVGLLGLAVTVLPGVLDGWHAAANLAAPTERTLSTMVPAWTMALLLTSTTLGALYSLWSRR